MFTLCRHVPTSFAMNPKICYIKIDVSCKASVNFHHMYQNATPATEFALCSPDNATRKTRNTTRLKCCPCHAKKEYLRWRSSKCCTCHEKCSSSPENHLKSIPPVTQNDFRRAMKHVAMSRSSTPATRNEDTRCLKPPKMITFTAVAIGTAIGSHLRSCCGRLPAVADGCERKRASRERFSTPRSPKVKREPVAALGIKINEKKTHFLQINSSRPSANMVDSTRFKIELAQPHD